MRTSVISLLTIFCGITLICLGATVSAQQEVNLALKANNPNVTATQSSVSEWPQMNRYGTADNAINGDKSGDHLGKVAETKGGQRDAWFEVDLGGFYKVNRIVMYPRTEACCQWFKSGYVIVTDQQIGAVPVTDDGKIDASSNFSRLFDPTYETGQPRTISVNGAIGRYIRIQATGDQQVQLAEIEIFGESDAYAEHTPTKAPWFSTTPKTGDPADPRNLARKAGVEVKQSSTFTYENSGPPQRAIDGKLDNNFAETLPDGKDKNSWFELDLKDNYKLEKLFIHSRTKEDCCLDQFRRVWVIVTDQELKAEPMLDAARIFYAANFAQFFEQPINGTLEVDLKNKVGRYVRIQTDDARIELKELVVIGDPAAGHKPNTTRSWTSELTAVFDPNFPNSRNPTQNLDHFNTLQRAPRIVAFKNANTSFDVAFQSLGSKTIKINSYEKSSTGFTRNAANSKSFEGLGIFGGFAKDSSGNRFVFTGESSQKLDVNGKTDWSRQTAKVFKNEVPFWDAMFAESKTVDKVKAIMHEGSSRLVVGKGASGKESLLIASNFAPAHPYQVVLDTANSEANKGRSFYESLYQHNFGQKAIFDGKDFVILENRDHDVSLTLSKIAPGEVFPLPRPGISAVDAASLSNEQKANDHANEYVKKIFSVYSHTNFINSTFTELGGVANGLNDTGGYLVLFAGERDWDYKMDGYDHKKENWAPVILSPRDIGLVHVKKQFADAPDKLTMNWLNKEGTWPSRCPPVVDTSKLVNSSGTGKTVKYKAANDGWDWANYAPACQKEIDAGQKERTLITKGVKWITTLGESHESSKTKATGEFTSVNHPKLVRIAPNKYIVLWEEWKAQAAGAGSTWAEPKKTYVTTKAVTITLSGSGESVNIGSSAITDLGKLRLSPGDDAFELEGKAAWVVGDLTKNKMVLYTVDEKLKVVSHELEI